MLPLAASLPAQIKSREAVRQALDRILVDPRSLWERLWDWLGEKLGFETGDLAAELGDVAGWVFLIAGSALLFVLFTRIARQLTASERVGAALGDPASALATRLAQLYRAAQESEARGELVEALRLYFFALVVGLGERGDLEYRDAWTNRELLERGDPDATTVAALRPLLTRLDAASFGRQPARLADLRRLEGLCARLFGKVPA